jgi:molecular chaperone GrpE (heat shock protein)
MISETPDNGAEVLQELALKFARKLSEAGKIEDFCESVVRMHTAPAREKYTDDFYFDIIKPLISRLTRLKDDTAKELRFLEAAMPEDAGDNADYAKTIIAHLLEDIDEMLLEHDVAPFVCEDKRFNPLRQKAVSVVKTEDPELVKTVAASLGCGYERHGAVLSKERVAAYAKAQA